MIREESGADEVLIVIDVQNDFCSGGALAIKAADEALPAINALIKRFDHVIVTQEWHPAGHSSFASSHAGKVPFAAITLPYGEQTLWPDHCVQGTRGAAFRNGFEWNKAELILRKGVRKEIDSYSAFFENDRKMPTGLNGYLRERGFTKVVFAGFSTDFCVAFSALDAQRHGYTTKVVLSACRAINLDGSMDAMARCMRSAGVELVG